MDIIFSVIVVVLLLVACGLEILTLRFVRGHRLTTERTTEEAIQTIAQDLNRIYQSVHVALQARGIGVPPLTPEGDPENLSEAEQERLRHLKKAEMFRKVRR